MAPNIYGEIEHPKSIMLGLDHYCGSISKLDAYVKGRYDFKERGKKIDILRMKDKLTTQAFCLTSWVDLFFSTNVHIIGLSLDYSEIDLWWVLNKRARFVAEGLVKNKVTFYTTDIKDEKRGLLESFNIDVVHKDVTRNDYAGRYKSFIKNFVN